MSELFTPQVVIPWLLAMVFGVFVGATPGLTATMAVALIVPLSFHMEANAGLAMIIGVSFTAIFAGDIPATYLRIPGTPASAAATLDGHELAKRGRGRFALQLNLLCSCIGGLVGVTLLILLAPQLAEIALLFSDFEYFWLGVLGLSMSAFVSQGSFLKGVIAACLGILIGTVGMDVVTGVPRFPVLESVGSVELMRGFAFIPVMIGLFGIGEVLRNVREDSAFSDRAAVEDGEQADIADSLLTIWKRKFLVFRSAIVGTIIGALPGAGADIAAWGAYGLAQRTSSEPGSFGHGTEEGVIAPTSANNAAVAGAWMPALVFGVPGDAVTAIVLGAMLMYDITPGPQLFDPEIAANREQLHSIFSIALITQLLLLPAGLLGVRAFGWLLKLPRRYVLTAVVVFSVVGAYALNNSMFDVYVMLAFGVIGFALESKKIPLAPLILGLILGDLIERKLRTGLISSGGDVTPMFTRPLCLLMIAAIVAMFLSMAIRRKPMVSPE